MPQLTDTEKKEIAERLKQAREKTGLNPRQYALDAGIDVSQYAKMEKGDLPITTKTLDKLVKKYNLDRNYILHGMLTVPHHGTNTPIIPNKAEEGHSESITLDQMTALYSSLIKALKDINSNVLATLQVTQENNSLAHAALVSHAEIRGKSAADIQHKLDDSLKYAKGYLEKFYGSSSENKRDHVKKVH
jgi:transcriptional regulator with XRE-family HTH domain